MTARCVCPHCDSVLAADPIPVDSLGYYGGEHGVPMDCRHGCGRPAHFSRLIGVTDFWEDRTVAWRCPDCEGEWAR